MERNILIGIGLMIDVMTDDDVLILGAISSKLMSKVFSFRPRCRLFIDIVISKIVLHTNGGDSRLPLLG